MTPITAENMSLIVSFGLNNPLPQQKTENIGQQQLFHQKSK